MLALSVCQRKKKERIEREGIIIETKRNAAKSMFQGKTANLLRWYIYFQREKNSNGPFQAEDSFVSRCMEFLLNGKKNER